jgi:hypothetical protein
VQNKKVVLCGGSLFIAGLDASLSAIPGLEIQCVNVHEEKDLEKLYSDGPNVIIVEMGLASGNLTLKLMREYPHVTLIALDPESESLLILSVRHHIVLAAADLEKVIQASPPYEEG